MRTVSRDQQVLPGLLNGVKIASARPTPCHGSHPIEASNHATPAATQVSTWTTTAGLAPPTQAGPDGCLRRTAVVLPYWRDAMKDKLQTASQHRHPRRAGATTWPATATDHLAWRWSNGAEDGRPSRNMEGRRAAGNRQRRGDIIILSNNPALRLKRCAP